MWGYASLLANPFLRLGANSEAFILLPLTNAVVAGSPGRASALLGTSGRDPMLDTIRETSGELYVLGDRSQIFSYADREPQRKYF